MAPFLRVVRAATQCTTYTSRGEWHAHDRRSARDWQVHIAAEWNTKDGSTPGHRHDYARPYVLIWERRSARCRREIGAGARDGGTTIHWGPRGRAQCCTACDGDKNRENKRFHELPFSGGGGFRSRELRYYYPNAELMIPYTQDLQRSVKAM